jgi:hypothetical protein
MLALNPFQCLTVPDQSQRNAVVVDELTQFSPGGGINQKSASRTSLGRLDPARNKLAHKDKGDNCCQAIAHIGPKERFLTR